jgi:hypothetical protein
MAMSRRHLFTGRSGQLALMAEFLHRELNVAIPEVDVGDDIVVVRDDNDQVTRVQVKTANARELTEAGRITAQFNVPLEQLEKGPQHLVYAFVVRYRDFWAEFVIVRRSILYELHTKHSLGSPDGNGNLILNLSFGRNEITTKGLNLHPFRRCFTPWPPTDTIPDGVVPASGEVTQVTPE